MSDTNDVLESLRALGFRSAPESMRALIEQLTKSRASPMETCEKLVALERRERDSHNLARRTRLASLGTHKPLDAFD